VKVLHVTESMLGGIGTYLRTLLPIQVKMFGADAVTLVAPREHLSHLGGIEGLRLEAYRRGGRDPISFIDLISTFSRTLIKYRPEIVHIHSTFAGVLCRPVGRIVHPNNGIVYCPHGWAFDMQKSKYQICLSSFLERYLAKITDAIIAVSEHECVRGVENGIPLPKLRKILNGLPDLSELPAVASGWPEHKFRLLFVGRLDHQKGVDLLLDAVSSFQETTHLRIAGASVVADFESNTLASKLGNVEFLGWQDSRQVVSQIASADVVVVPSRWEAFGLVAIEAMRAGKPVIAAAVGGLPEIVVDGKTGLLIEPNDPAALKGAISSIQSADLVKMGELARRRFKKHFQAAQMADEVATVYSDIMARR